ncbi:DMT family transporter [Ancylobacter pratisalsi]|uniref:DMT family transporter n=1 Tax=Ancylobacter pratisalsi TaxID=1745854 RepID=A0A6P1YRQ6_9HYPH|nr:DMT family transporter [Ancylobacter pratisalsi]QIB36197.1 DMT family transporter [Ancylobacter pratisalsi]
MSQTAPSSAGNGAAGVGRPQPMATADWLSLGLLSLIWGGSFFFGKIAIAEVPPLTMVLARVAIGAAALFVIARLSGVRVNLSPALAARFAVLAMLANIIPFGLIAWSQQHLPSGLSSILNAATPLFTVLVAQAFTRDEKLTTGKLVGVALGFAGVAVMMGPALLGQLGGHQLPAQLAAIGATISYGFAAVYARRFRQIPPLGVALLQLATSSVLLLPLVAILERPWLLPMPSPTVWGALIGLGVLSTGLAFILYFRIVARNGATNISLVTFLVPVSAILLGAVFLGEALEPRELAGFGLIGLGLAAIDGRLARWIAGAVSR